MGVFCVSEALARDEGGRLGVVEMSHGTQWLTHQDQARRSGINFNDERRVEEMASDAVVKDAIQKLNKELVQIRKVLDRIAAALEKQAEHRIQL